MPAPASSSPTDEDRAALLRFEAAYEQWRLAEAALAEAEIRLWTETLRSADGEACRRLAAETLKLREVARTARQGVLALLMEPRS